MAARRLNRDDYTVGWICALPIERAAAEGMLDEKHQRLPNVRGDSNAYTYGAIHGHNVVIACLPGGRYGASSATAVAKDMLRSFRIRVALMVGIGGGVPKNNVRLGDVVVSQPIGQYGGVVQYDFGKAMADGVFHRTGFLNSPPTVLLNALSELISQHEMLGDQSHIHIEKMIETFPQMKEGYAFSDRLEDLLFRAEDIHLEESEDCEPCRKSFKLVQRKEPKSTIRSIHYGLIASGNQVIKDGKKRDEVDKDANEKVLCFEMEAAGLMNDFPCLVVRGICDYSDSHKNKKWQKYAAAIAAAYTKDFLGCVASEELLNTPVAALDYRVPFDLKGMPMVDHFVGREADLQVLEEQLLPQNRAKERKIFFLSGLGGMGKTQLAVKFARKNAQKYDSIFWLDGRAKTSLVQSIAAIGPRIPSDQCDERYRSYGSTDVTAEEVSIHVRQWFCRPDNSKWLLIFDNIDHNPSETHHGDEYYDFRDYLPSADHGTILVTTRLKHLGNGHHLLPLQDSDSLELLQRKTHKDIAVESSSLNKLLKKLDGLPLALAQAGAYIMQTGCSVTEYLNSYEQNWKELKEAEDQHKLPLDDYPKSIINTWSISYHQISQNDKAAAFLLKLWACLDNGDLWHDLFTPVLLMKKQSLPLWFKERVETSIGFQTVVSTLLNYSLVQRKASNEHMSTSYYMHPVVHSWLYRTVIRDLTMKNVDFEMLALHIIDTAVPSNDKAQYWVLQRRILPHANYWYQLYRDQEYNSREFSVEILFMFHNLGDLFGDFGHTKEAEGMYRRALEGMEKALGAEHTSTLITVNNLGVLYKGLGRMEESEAMCLRALEGREKALGAEHISTLGTLNNLGIIYQGLGRKGKAEVNNLGVIYQDLGRMEESEAMCLRALEGREKALGAEHISTLGTLNNLGNLYQDLGRMEESEAMYRRALEGREKALGAEHTSTLDTINNLGVFYKGLERMEESEAMYRRALDGYKKAYGREHQKTVVIAKNLKSLQEQRAKSGNDA